MGQCLWRRPGADSALYQRPLVRQGSATCEETSPVINLSPRPGHGLSYRQFIAAKQDVGGAASFKTESLMPFQVDIDLWEPGRRTERDDNSNWCTRGLLCLKIRRPRAASSSKSRPRCAVTSTYRAGSPEIRRVCFSLFKPDATQGMPRLQPISRAVTASSETVSAFLARTAAVVSCWSMARPQKTVAERRTIVSRRRPTGKPWTYFICWWCYS